MPEARRYRDRRPAVRVSASTTTLPGLIVLSFGVVILLAGVILLAAYGIPNNVSEYPRQIAAPVLISAGTLVSLIGIACAVHLNKRARQIKEEKGENATKQNPSKPKTVGHR